MEKTLKKLSWYSFLTLIMVVIFGVMLVNKPKPAENNLSGVNVGSECLATTTDQLGGTLPLLNAKAATLCSVIITKAGTATLDIYNATTTNVNLRTGQIATSSLLRLATFPASPTVGAYPYEVRANTGIIAVWGTGSVSSTTISTR